MSSFRGRPTWAEIDLDAIAHNVGALKARVGPRVELMAVVKANAYGHGTLPVARTALESGASSLAVAFADEGVVLRQAGIECPILVMGYSPAWEAEKLVVHRLMPTMNTLELAHALAAASRQEGVISPVQVKVDTGLGRYGLLPNETVDFAQAVIALPHLRLAGVWTHFASADEADKSHTRRQLEVFHQVLARLAERGIQVPCRHAANSAATIELPEAHFDLVRCGIAIYGLYPSPEVSRKVELRPAMSLKSRVGRLRTLPAGTSISYNRTYVTDRPTKVALVPVGYADGLIRALSNRGALLVNGRRAPILGRVCMDQCVVNVDDCPQVQQDDEAVAIGRQGGEEITAEEAAAWAGTINYEVVCAVSARVPRLYLRGGQPVDV